MRILLTFDDAYAPHAATLMESVVRNCPEKLGFVVIHYDLSETTQTILTRHFEGRIKSLEFFKVDKTTLNDITKGIIQAGWNKIAVWLRVFAPALLPPDEHYIIYLDCDIIVCDNILKMADGADLSKPICTVTEYNPAYKWNPLVRSKFAEFENIYVREVRFYRACKNLGMSDDASYFCDGTMIMNLDYWREHKIAEQAIAFALEHPEKIYVGEQDALNHIFNGNYGELHPRWDDLVVGTTTGYPTEWLLEAKRNPAIIHAKGWLYNAPPDARKQYRKYRKFTPWPKIKYTDKTIFAVLQRFLSPLYRSTVRPLTKALLLLGKYEVISHRHCCAKYLTLITKQTD
jgi:lipopolysaccharide biosynthesis glycosyltransferase